MRDKIAKGAALSDGLCSLKQGRLSVYSSRRDTLMYHILRAFDLTAMYVARYVLLPISWFFGLTFHWLAYRLGMVGNFLLFVFFAAFHRVMHFFAVVWFRTFGSPQVTGAVASVGEAQGRAFAFGARKFYQVAEAPIWQKGFLLFANLFFRMAYTFSFLRWWMWSRTFGSSTVQTAAATAEHVPQAAIGMWLQKLDQMQESRLGRSIVATARVMLVPFDGLMQFAFAWLVTRNFRLLRAVIPIIVLAVPFFYVAIKLPFETVDGRAARYQRAAEVARVEGHNVDAELYERKLASMGVTNDGYEFRKALQNEPSVGAEATMEIMLRLAPHEGKGYPEAHRWVGLMLASGTAKLQDRSLPETVLHHLRQYIDNRGNDAAALQVMAEMYLQQQQYAQSLDCLHEIALSELDRVNMVRLASSFQRSGDSEAAIKVAGMAIVKFEQGTPANYSVEEFMFWVVAERLRGDHAGMADVLLVMSQHVPQDDAKSFEKIAALCIKRAATDGADSFVQAAKKCIRALPNNEEVGAAISAELADDEISDRLSLAIKPEIEQGLAPVQVLGRMADMYAVNGRQPLARDVYERILEKDPTDIRIANNLAWLWATVEPFDLKRAMSFANTALEIDPSREFVLETRGQIFFKLEKYHEAITDLTKALNGLPNYAPIHETLAKCYEKTGQKELSDYHHRIQERIYRENPSARKNMISQ
ncbi:MAG: hypothetical protein KDB27_34785 [Planctomycetales bacterium]|nr:hypothetical protein [Planctomycetales bacterium]